MAASANARPPSESSARPGAGLVTGLVADLEHRRSLTRMDCASGPPHRRAPTRYVACRARTAAPAHSRHPKLRGAEAQRCGRRVRIAVRPAAPRSSRRRAGRGAARAAVAERIAASAASAKQEEAPPTARLSPARQLCGPERSATQYSRRGIPQSGLTRDDRDAPRTHHSARADARVSSLRDPAVRGGVICRRGQMRCVRRPARSSEVAVTRHLARTVCRCTGSSTG